MKYIFLARFLTAAMARTPITFPKDGGVLAMRDFGAISDDGNWGPVKLYKKLAA